MISKAMPLRFNQNTVLLKTTFDKTHMLRKTQSRSEFFKSYFLIPKAAFFIFKTAFLLFKRLFYF